MQFSLDYEQFAIIQFYIINLSLAKLQFHLFKYANITKFNFTFKYDKDNNNNDDKELYNLKEFF